MQADLAGSGVRALTIIVLMKIVLLKGYLRDWSPLFAHTTCILWLRRGILCHVLPVSLSLPLDGQPRRQEKLLHPFDPFSLVSLLR